MNIKYGTSCANYYLIRLFSGRFWPGIFSGALLAALGIFVVLRKMAFFSDGIAHTALAGVAIALLVGQQPLVWAVGMGVVFSVAIYFLEKKTDIAPDSLIGILFTSSLALGVVLMNFKKGYQPDLLSFLFGNILTIRSGELWIIIPLAAVILGFVLFNYRKYLFICLNDELAKSGGHSYGNLSASCFMCFWPFRAYWRSKCSALFWSVPF